MMYKKLLVVFALGLTVLSARAQEEGRRVMREATEDTEENTEEGDAEPQEGQEVKPRRFRYILNKITLTTSLGYGLNNYRSSLEGFTIDSQNGRHYLYDQNVGVTDWLYAPQIQVGYNPGSQTASGDTLKLRAFNHSLPLNLGLHVLIKERFKVGGSVGLEMFSIGTMVFKEPTPGFEEYDSNLSSALALRYYGMVGYRTMHFLFWDHFAELRIGKRNPITKFSGESTGLFINAGYQLERNFSEYFRFTFRPSLEYHSFTTQPFNVGNASIPSDLKEKELKTSVPSLYLEAGISLNYPRLPRCPIKGCETQVDHVHYGNQYRGQPITRWQNPKMGQNHRELERYKRRKKDDTEQQLQYQKPRRRKFLWFR